MYNSLSTDTSVLIFKYFKGYFCFGKSSNSGASHRLLMTNPQMLIYSHAVGKEKQSCRNSVVARCVKIQDCHCCGSGSCCSVGSISGPETAVGTAQKKKKKVPVLENFNI